MPNFWDERFAEPGYKYGTAPNAFLREQAAALPARAQVLVPGDGEGRNGVWLAQQGHSVLAVDYSEVGLAKARALAAERGAETAARLATQWADLADWAPPAASFDAVALVFCHLPSTLRQLAHPRLAAALRPGGLLIVEAFHPDQLGRASGGPKDVDMLYTLADLRADFAGLLDEAIGWEGEVPLDEGPGHQGLGQVTRYVGRRR
jgi:SAM-dependent methyltransferase